MDYLNKYLKYKQKYINLKKLKGGTKDYYLPCEICHCTNRMYIGNIKDINGTSFHNYLIRKSDFIFTIDFNNEFSQDPRIILKSNINNNNYLIGNHDDNLLKNNIFYLNTITNNDADDGYSNLGGNYISSPYDKKKIFCINSIYFPIDQENIDFFNKYIDQELIELECSFEGHIDEMMCFMPYGINNYKIWFYDEIKIDQIDNMLNFSNYMYNTYLISNLNITVISVLYNNLSEYLPVTRDILISEFKEKLQITNEEDINLIFENINKDSEFLKKLITECMYKQLMSEYSKNFKIKIILNKIESYKENTHLYSKDILIKSINKKFKDDLILIDKLDDLIIHNLFNNDIKNLIIDCYRDHIISIIELYNDAELIGSNNINIILEKINLKTSLFYLKNDILLNLAKKNINIKKYIYDLLNKERERNISKICESLSIDIDKFVFFPLKFKYPNELYLKKNKLLSLKNPTIFNRIYYETPDNIYCFFFSIGSDEEYNSKITELVESEKPNIKSFIDSNPKNIYFIYINTQMFHDTGAGNGGNLHCLSKQIYE